MNETHRTLMFPAVILCVVYYLLLIYNEVLKSDCRRRSAIILWAKTHIHTQRVFEDVHLKYVYEGTGLKGSK